MNFIGRLLQKSKEIDKKQRVCIEIEKELHTILQRFNIHKRTLPVGTDKIVVYNVPFDEARWWIQNQLKTEQIKDCVVYYDIIDANAGKTEKNVLYNTGPFMMGELNG